MDIRRFILPALVLALPLGASAQEGPRLTDPEVAHVAVTANAIDVELAELARSRAQVEEVRAFARTMISDHTAVNGRAAALAAELGVTPLDNDVSRSLRSEAGAVRERLEGLDGSDFDVAYMEREVAYHQAVLDAIDALLIPSAQNPRLKALLGEVRPAIAAHLGHARTIVTDLSRRP